MSDGRPWPHSERRTVAQRVRFNFHLNSPEDVGSYRLIEVDLFEGWCPPVPWPGETIAFNRADWIQVGTVESTLTSYGPDGVTYDVTVGNNAIHAPGRPPEREEPA